MWRSGSDGGIPRIFFFFFLFKCFFVLFFHYYINLISYSVSLTFLPLMMPRPLAPAVL